MYKLRTPPVTMTLWKHHGDHPDVHEINSSTPSAMVRYVDSGLLISDMDKHGWIHAKFGVSVVAPGDYLAIDAGGAIEVVKANELDDLYEVIHG